MLASMETNSELPQSPLAWFEIPATDLDRATRFYETVLGVTLQRFEMGPAQMALFPYVRPGVGGAIESGPGHHPSPGGAIVYFQAKPTVAAVLERVEPAGGAIVVPRTELPPGMGVFARVRDTEGNVVGVHALA